MRKTSTKAPCNVKSCAVAAAAGLLCLCLGAGNALAFSDGGQYLTPADLRTLTPAYEAFLQELADVIIERGLISPEEREDWLMYQLGDFYQNGGLGMIAAMFNPGLLAEVRPQDSLLRLRKEFPNGTTLHVDTMAAYSPLDGTMPGLMLEASFADAQGLPVRCRFRWRCEQGGFSTWDALGSRVADVGIEYINDGRRAYWSDQPIIGEVNAVWHIELEVLAPDDNSNVLGSAVLVLTPSGSGWELNEDSLR
ncbi:MAG: hypothetical protein FWD25_05570 [Clostridia bacterium]|nr:hypothetical protein [Clostridia bacterium]